jgi:hypothetical protein
MDKKTGGVSLQVITGFNRVQSLLASADYVQRMDESKEPLDMNELVKECIKESALLECVTDSHGIEAIRLINGWDYWILKDDSVDSATTTPCMSVASVDLSENTSPEKKLTLSSKFMSDIAFRLSNPTPPNSPVDAIPLMGHRTSIDVEAKTPRESNLKYSDTVFTFDEAHLNQND